MGQVRDNRLLKKIAVAVKELRQEAGLTQEDVYNETNIHIGRIETAKANLTISTLAGICKFFNISLSSFFERVEKLS